MPDSLWTLRNVRLGGRGASRLDDVSVCLRPGVTAVLGASGAGKTSLLNLLVEFERPDSGSVTRHAVTDGRLPVYWVPQDGGLWPHLTVREHLRAVATAAPEEELTALLDVLAVGATADSRPDALSMGERARVAVARALAARPAVLVMDEPLAHVDRARTDGYWAVIRSHVAASGASLIFATHSPETVLAEAERVICLHDGRLVYDGEVERLYRDPADREQAECLGPTNWLPGAEAAAWIGGTANGRACYRPADVEAVREPDGPLEVQSYRFRGALAESEVLHRRSGRRRRLLHLSSRPALRPGERIRLRALLVILLAFVLAGCGGGEAALHVKEIDHWSMPPEGKMVPAPRSVAVGQDGEVIVLDTAGRVIVFDERGRMLRSWYMPEYETGKPEGVCVLADGRIVVSDTHYHRVVIFDRDGNVLKVFGREGRAPGEFIYPVGITRDDADHLYVCEYGGNDRVQKFTADGEFLLAFGSFGAGERQFQRPSGMAWRAGKVYVADAINDRVLIYSDEGDYLGVLGGPELALGYPYDIVLGGDDRFYIVEYRTGRLTAVTPDGRLLGRFGSTGRGEGQLSRPWGLAIDEKSRVRIADTDNRRIVELRL